MNIGIFTPYNIYKPGGVQNHVNEQARVLRQRGHTVTIITPRPRDKTVDEAPEGVRFLGVSTRIMSPSATSTDVSVAVDNEAIDAELSNNYDILHVHEPLNPVVGRQLLQRAEGVSIRVGTFHAALAGNGIGRSLNSTYRGYARTVVPHVDVVTAVSPAAIDFIKKYVQLPIHFVPNGIDMQKFRHKTIKRDPNMILYINRLEKRKGPKLLIDAFEVIKQRNPDAVLKIGSNGPLRESLEQHVMYLGVRDVEFLGYITDEEKLDLLSRCSVYTAPSLYGESFGIVLTEAMAMGAPVVAHPNPGYAWVMKGMGRASLVDCRNPENYARHIEMMMQEETLRKSWVDWALEYVKQYDYEFVVDSYEKLYETYLENGY